MMRKFLITLLYFFATTTVIFAQVSLAEKSSVQSSFDTLENVLSFEEYLAYVKMHHPLMKQAELSITEGEATLLKARGGFDPKVEVDYDRKKFKGTEYFDQLNATFKIPTWYGIEFKANFEENTGQFLNPNLTVPDGGLYSAGVSFSLAQGLLMNDRMASLKKAQFFQEQTQADRNLLVNNLLFEASIAYFNWVQATKEQQIFEDFLSNARTRLKAVKRSVEEGDKAAIDSIEARIIFKNRQLAVEAATLKRQKASLEVGTFLWLQDVPLELQENVVPVLPAISHIETSLLLEETTNVAQLLENHPKLLSLDAKIKGLAVDRSLKRNKLLPKLDVQYNFLSPQSDQLNSFNTANYKTFVNFSVPLFLRKERGDVRLANLKLQETNFERLTTSLKISNKVEAMQAEIASLATQNQLISAIVEDYTTLVQAEERMFFLGASSLFLINAREQKLMDAQLKENELVQKELAATAKLYNALGVSEPILSN